MSSLLAHNPLPPSLTLSLPAPALNELPRSRGQLIGPLVSLLHWFSLLPPIKEGGGILLFPQKIWEGGGSMENGRVMEFKLMLQEAISSRHLASLWTEPKEMGLHPTPPLFFKSNWERFFPHSTLAKNDSFFLFFYFCFRTTTIRAWLRTESSPGRKGRGRK